MTSNETASMQLTLAELRAKVTEAEAAYGRFRTTPGCMGLIAYEKRDEVLTEEIHAAREALRKAEEAERKPRLRTAQTVAAKAEGWCVRAIQDRDAEWLAAIRKLPQYSTGQWSNEKSGATCRTVPAVLLSDIEALVREAGE